VHARYRPVVALGGASKESREVLEGGDLMILGTTVLAGRLLDPAVGSSAIGIARLTSRLGPQGYTVEDRE
jgi:hypothetical protein